MEIDEIKSLIDLMNDNSLAEIEIEEKGKKIRLVKQDQRRREVVAVPTQMVAPAQFAPGAEPLHAAPVENNLHEIVAPMVGTFYSSPSPDSEPFAEISMKLTEDTTVCIIEAMKVMNEIRAEVVGTLVEVLVENGQPVEYGQPLFRVKLEE